MGKKKQQTQQQQTNTYQWMQAPESADVTALRGQINQAYDNPDPSIAYNFAQRRGSLMDRYDNPFGANYSPEVRDAARYAGMNDLDQQQGQALREDASARKTGKIAAQAGLAGLTSPQLVQTGSSGNSTTTQSSGILGGILSAGAGIGQAALLAIPLLIVLAASYASA